MRTSLKLFIVFVFSTQIAVGQSSTSTSFELLWKAPVEEQSKTYLFFEEASYNSQSLPVYAQQYKETELGKVVLKDVITTPLPAEWALVMDPTLITNTEFEVKTLYKKANSGNYSLVEVLPFRKINGVIEILISASLDMEIKKTEPVEYNKPKTLSHSVLSTGNWLKIGIAQNGLYKITFEQLQTAGLVGGAVNSSFIRLHGNGGGALPEENSAFRYDDLEENAIEVVDGGDGNFNSGDYILFYAQGAHQSKFNTTTQLYEHAFNLYADTNYYFVTIGNTSGLRLGSRNSLGGAPTYTTSTGDGYVFMESDQVSLYHSGRLWMGDHYNFNNTYTYHFNLDNISTSDSVKATVKMASRCVACNTTLVIQHNNTTFLSLYPPACSPSYTSDIATVALGTGSFVASGSSVDLKVVKTLGDEAWMDYIDVNYRKNITSGGSFSVFSDRKSVGQTNVKFIVSNTNANQQIWDVTDPLKPIRQNFSVIGTTGEFQVDMDTLRSFVVLDPSGASAPANMLSIPNQDLHALTETSPPADFVIITHPSFTGAANDLAQFHTQHDNMVVHVVTTDQIYNEYGSGKQDISAIRDFIKMYYDKNPSDYPPYILLFGDGSIDYKPYLKRLDFPNTNIVPAFETVESFNRSGNSYSSDDFYGLLDNDEGVNGRIVLNGSSNLDVGVGRLPARTADEAQGIVNKIKYYATNTQCMGDWRNVVTVVADDMEAGWEGNFLTGSEAICNQINNIDPVWNADKIYLDAYQQVSNAGQRYPEAEKTLFNRINKGSLFINYIGHGGETGWTAERLIQYTDFLNLTNLNNLPVFTTATCTFTRFDNPEFNSAGEYLIQLPDKGSIGLYSTIRPISIVPTFNQKFYKAAYTPLPSGEMPRMGDIIRLGKQPPNSDFGEFNILLFGDPALMLAYPKIKVVTDSINGMYAADSAGFVADTLMASQLVTISGHIEDNSGAFQAGYNGDLYTTIFDKASQLTTLGNDGGTQFPFQLRKNVIFKGASTIKDGRFSFQFVVPLDINYLIGEGKISYYATDNQSIDAQGLYKNFSVGGSSNNCSTDAEGPAIEVFLNDTNFQEMGITQRNTTLVVKVSDANGINTTGLGIGHDLQAIIDNDIQNPIVLNNYYQADENSFTNGIAKYLINGLDEGIHTVTVQVWDGCNNPSSATLNFAVTNNEAALINMLAYPNPFNENVILAFEHNFQGKQVNAVVDIMDIHGVTARTFVKDYIPQGNREVSITWDGRSQGGEKMASGVYICRVVLTDNAGNQAAAACKIILVD